MNLPQSPTAELIQSIVKMYGIDIILILDDVPMADKLRAVFDVGDFGFSGRG